MAHPSRKPDQGDLPQKELNPLENPLLAANMGRWAEVYFTTPPDRRDEAVAELVRVLEREAQQSTSQDISDRAQDAARPLPVEQKNGAGVVPTSGGAFSRDQVVHERNLVCDGCGHSNAFGQRFCVMCGNALSAVQQRVDERKEYAGTSQPEFEPRWEASSEFARVEESAEVAVDLDSAQLQPEPHDTISWPPREPSQVENESYDARENVASGETRRPEAVPSEAEEQAPAFEIAESDLPQFARETKQVPYRYRLYLGVAMAIVVAGLIYAAQRGNVFSDGQESPAAKTLPAAQPASPASESAPPPASADQNANAPAVQSAPAQKRTTSQNQPITPPPVRQRPQRQQAPAPVPVPASNSSAQPNVVPAAQTGNEEFAEAESYLNGTRGGARNSQEAAQLLWKAVAKGNAPATLTLSDLYLRGDGVAQNCDQARLLLDIALKKGAKGAAERLRHMQAFGCR